MSNIPVPTQKKGKGAVAFVALFMVGIVVLPIWFFFVGPMIRHDRLEKNGVRAPGRLLAVDETGTVVNDSPELELTIEFRQADGTLDTSTTDFVPSRRTLHYYQPGTSVTAAYDPEDPDEITVLELNSSPMQTVSETIATPSSTSTVDSLMRAVDSLRREVESLKGR
jgi:hypothetical protein